MSDRLSMHDSDWKLFGRNGQSGMPLLFRSRTHVAQVREFAEQNAMGRVRCVLGEGDLNDAGMPRSADDLNAFEDWMDHITHREESGVQPNTVFFPIHRIEKIILDEGIGVIPSLSDTFLTKVGSAVEEHLEQ